MINDFDLDRRQWLQSLLQAGAGQLLVFPALRNATKDPPTFDVRHFGAKGDGRSDDTLAIQATIMAARQAGGGTVYIPTGTYILGQPQGIFKILLRPASNVWIKGDGPRTILRAANDLNVTGRDSGYNFIRHIVADQHVPRIDNFTVSNLTFDHNGSRNLIPASHVGKDNVAVGVEVGENIRVENCTFIGNAGRQTLSFGNNASPQPIHNLTIQNNTFHEMGGSIISNRASTDHSTIYAQCIGGVLQNNVFQNSNPAYKNTAIEVHSVDCIIRNNTVVNYEIMFNICAIIADMRRVTIQGNTCRGVASAARFWQNHGYTLDAVSITGNTFAQGAEAPEPFLNLTSNVVQGLSSVQIIDNTFTSTVPAGAAATAAAIEIGKIASLTLQHNTIRGFPGRAIECATIQRGMHLVIEDNIITDCGTTANPAYREGIILNELTPIDSLSIQRNRIANTASRYMTRAIGGNAPVTQGTIADNEVTGVSIPYAWHRSTNILLRMHGSGPPTVPGIIGSQYLQIDANGDTIRYVKKQGQDTTGWVRQ